MNPVISVIDVETNLLPVSAKSIEKKIDSKTQKTVTLFYQILAQNLSIHTLRINNSLPYPWHKYRLSLHKLIQRHNIQLMQENYPFLKEKYRLMFKQSAHVLSLSTGYPTKNLKSMHFIYDRETKPAKVYVHLSLPVKDSFNTAHSFFLKLDVDLSKHQTCLIKHSYSTKDLLTCFCILIHYNAFEEKAQWAIQNFINCLEDIDL